MFVPFDFEHILDATGEIIMLEAIELSKRLDKRLCSLPVGSILKITSRPRSMRDVITLVLALRLVRASMIGKGRDMRVCVNGKMLIVEVVSRDYGNFGVDVKGFIDGLCQIAKIWKRIRNRVGDWIEKFMNIIPYRDFRRYVQVFEALDLLVDLLLRLAKK